ncbi:MAG: hypothetical protein COC06_11395 [Bacteroidales bacterium]|nr:MAG: hypothetical protein COC06_11395 [Bacteroidales bacterium]
MTLLRIKDKLTLLFTFLLVGTLLVSCSKDDDDNVNDNTGDFVLSMALQGSDGAFTYHTVQFEDVMSGSLSAVGQGVEQLGYYSYNQYGEKIYCSGGLGVTNLEALERGTDGNIQEIASLTNFKNSLIDLVEVDANNLVGVELSSSSDVVKLHLIDAADVSVTKTTETLVSDLTALSSPAYSGMVVSGNYLYLSYYISDPSTFATSYTDKAELAIFSYPELEFIKVIEDDRTGPIGGFGTSSGLIKDEDGTIYALSHSNPANGYSQVSKKGGILRIESGETEFDADYFFDIESITGGKNTAHLLYLGNGKVFTEMNTQVNSEQSRWSDGPLKPAVIDLYNNTLTYVEGVPEHAGTGRKLAATALQDGKYVYLAVPEDTGIYVYQINTADFTSVKGAEIEANFVAGFFKL